MRARVTRSTPRRKCPHCTIHFHDNWDDRFMERRPNGLVESPDDGSGIYWHYRSALCPNCGDVTIEVARWYDRENRGEAWRQIYPIGASRGPVSPEVPDDIAQDYIEACNVLPISPKASAALSRRCLQNILHGHGYEARALAREIDLLMNESDPKKALSHGLRETIDSIRNFGNFSAHPIDDRTSLQIIGVEPHEAEWCLQILEDMFEHFYVGPAAAKAKQAALNMKLAAAGKPPSK
jgi:Domain of unknown function (DUF4145)